MIIGHMQKRASAGEWVLLISVVVLLNVGTYFLVINKSYSKNEVDSLVEKIGCSYVEVYAFNPVMTTANEYVGKTPTAICGSIDKSPEFVVTRDYTTVSDSTNNIYNDENYFMDKDFSSPFKDAVDIQREYGHPGFGNTGTINRQRVAVLCC